MDPNTETREQIVKSITGEQAHLSFADAVADFPADQINTRPTNLPYSFWHLIEHVRITQHDLLDYITRADYEEGTWPDDYWPDLDTETDQAGWNASLNAFFDDRNALIAIAQDPGIDLSAGVPTHAGHSIERCLLIVGNHNSYHLGEFSILRQVMNNWGGTHS
jgi:hypothetical protein